MIDEFKIKKIIPLMLVVFFITGFSLSSNAENITISFSEDEFSFSTNDNGNLVITSAQKNVNYLSADEPGLPVLSAELAVPKGYMYLNSTVEYTKRLIFSDVTIANSPSIVETNRLNDITSSEEIVTYSKEEYPSTNCQYICSTNWKDATVLHFLLSPFVYNAKERNLYFIDSIKVKIDFKDGPSKKISVDKLKSSLLKSMVLNGDDVGELTVENSNQGKQIDYVIITTDSLKSAFYPLAVWKRTKGIYSEILSIEDIEKNYEASSLQGKIKKCILELYSNNGLKYVLLGGDDSIVPVRGCYCKVNDRVDETIPTDLFYGCFGGNFDWDSNGNGIYGELDDSVDFSPNVFVTRVPVRTSLHVENFVTKLLKYEKKPVINNSMLMCGVKLWNYFDTEEHDGKASDAELKGKKLFDSYIKPYWNGEKVRFYDTYTDFGEESEYNITEQNLKEQISLGYTFFDIMTHGSQTHWSLEDSQTYSVLDGKCQENSSSTIVTTMACNTNAFDFSKSKPADPCLSESLIRNEYSGVIAYLGCSREGWGFRTSYLGPSLQYESQFYSKLLSNNLKDKNFGLVVAASKSAMISFSGKYNAMRWIQLGLNPIGDPEMPIYTAIPLQFDNIVLQEEKGSIYLCTNVPECRICVMSINDDGEEYYKVFEDVNTISLTELPDECSICITKQGYVPCIYAITYIQNQVLTGINEYEANDVKIGNSVTTSKASGDAVFSDGKTIIKANCVTLAPGTRIKKGAMFKIKLKSK
jgi:hypothetical protein